MIHQADLPMGVFKVVHGVSGRPSTITTRYQGRRRETSSRMSLGTSTLVPPPPAKAGAVSARCQEPRDVMPDADRIRPWTRDRPDASGASGERCAWRSASPRR